MKQNDFLLYKSPAYTIIIAMAVFIQFACKKTYNASYFPSGDKLPAFLQLPINADTNLNLLIGDLNKQLQKNNFSAEFVKLHGQPLWQHAITVKKDYEHLTFYIPTQKSAGSSINSFFIATYNQGKWSYEIHQRSMLDSKQKEPTSLHYSKADYAKILAYFNYKILDKKDTLKSIFPDQSALNTSKIINPQQNGSNGKMITVCTWITETIPCGLKTNESNWTIPKCYHDVYTCFSFEDGSGGSGGTGNGDPGSGGGGGNGDTPTPPCQQNKWYDPVPCQEIPQNCEYTEQEAQQILDNIVPEELYITKTESLGPQVNQNGIIKEPKIHAWKFFSLNILPGFKPEWSAYFKGVRFKSTQNAPWKWESFEYVNTARSGGTMAPCIDAQMSTIVASLISQDKSKATATLYYICQVKIPCLLGMEVNSTYSNNIDDDIFAWE